MAQSNGKLREIVVPVSVFALIRRELKKEAGGLPTIRALHHAGYESGATAAAAFDSAARASQGAFWTRLSDFFFRRGWGRLTHLQDHPGIGTLRSSDWAEASPEDDDPDGSCSFSTGFLSGLLSEFAEAPVAVLEVECRTRGDDHCRFAFGSETAVHELYGHLLEGHDLDGALAAL